MPAPEPRHIVSIKVCKYRSYKDLIKIGITSNLKQRVASIGGTLEVVHSYYLNNPRHYETVLHKKYQSYNKFNHTVRSGGTEFFNLTNQQIEEIDQYVRSI